MSGELKLILLYDKKNSVYYITMTFNIFFWLSENSAHDLHRKAFPGTSSNKVVLSESDNYKSEEYKALTLV